MTLESVELLSGNDVSFSMWLAEFSKIAAAWHDRYGNCPYLLPLDATAEFDVACWRDCFDDDMTPQEAFDSDKSYWTA